MILSTTIRFLHLLGTVLAQELREVSLLLRKIPQPGCITMGLRDLQKPFLETDWYKPKKNSLAKVKWIFCQPPTSALAVGASAVLRSTPLAAANSSCCSGVSSGSST